MPRRPCLTCGTPTPNTYCHDHNPKQKRGDLQSWRWRQHSLAIRKAWIDRHGFNCPGYQRGPHPATDLTVDHINPVGQGGTPTGPTQVLCRACNGRKGQTERRT